MTTAVEHTYDLRTFCSAEFRAMVAAGILGRQDREAVLDGSYRFTADQYQSMGMAGILSEYEPIELLNGEIVEMAPVGITHNDTTDCISDLMFGALLGRARIRVQGSVRINELSEPQPDFAILRQRPDYHLSPATPADILFIVEVSYSSLSYDRGEKLAAYAAAGIPELWIVNLREYAIYVHTDPAGEEYLTIRRFQAGDTVSPLAFPDVVLPVSGFWSGMVGPETEAE
ncbi:MAG: Uma2 family endonuclease [Chloroflexota bacterium]|nr:Uma2 family endonuclease [Chloroflexota bacterium]MDE2958889.1 Uma2 family endonuclease [Chloroflexota bacterium]